MQSQLSRRNFLKSSAALAVSAPTVISATALGNETAAAPSERITLGFIGIGKQATNHLNGMTSRKDTQTLAVCDVHKLRMQTAHETVEKIYTDLERKSAKSCDAFAHFHDVLGRKDIDAVVIGTPDHWHSPLIIEAAKAKKDIYCEKPLTLTIHEAKTVIAAVRKHERVMQTGSQMRSGCKYHEVRQHIQSGRIGKIKEVHAALVGPGSKPCDLPDEALDLNVDFDLWLGQAPQRGYNEILCRKPGKPTEYPFYPGWRDYREYSGGRITDFGAHELDMLQWTLRMDHNGPSEVTPPEDQTAEFGAKLVYAKTPFGDNIVVTHLKEILSPNKKPQSRGLLFIGETGKIFANASTAISDPEEILKEPLKTHVQSSTSKMLPLHHANFLDCIRTRQKPVADVAIGAGSVTCCHLLNLAYWHRRKLKWDAQAWEFSGDAEANGWRDRPRREKYQLPEI
jgi:ketosteroid isomerase-like protein